MESIQPYSLNIATSLESAHTNFWGDQQQLVQLIDSLPGIVFSATNDPEWSMLHLSKGCFRLTGYHSEELVGKHRITSYNHLTHPDDLPFVLQGINQAIAQKQPYLLEYRVRTKSGAEKWFWEKGNGVFDAKGNILGLQGFISDITDRKQVEEALQQSETRFRTIFEDAAIGIGATDLNGLTFESNPAIQRMLGYSAEQLKTLTFSDYTHPDDIDKDIALYQELLAGQRDHYQIEKRYIRKDGQTFWADLAVSAIRNEQGELQFTFGMIEDITERKQTEEALRQAEAKYRSIVENAVEGIFQSTLEGRYLTINPMLARIYGYGSPEELMETLTDIQHQLYVDPARRTEFIQLIQERGAVWGFESEVYRRDGSVIWISESARALYNSRGQLLGYEGTVEEVTDRKQSEAELRKRDALLQAVAAATNCLLTHANLSVAIPEVLAILGQASSADRVYLYENHPHPKTGELAMSLRFEWTQPAIESGLHKPHWQNQPYSAFGMTRWYEAFSQGQAVGGVVREFPTAEQEILKHDRILALLMVPVFVDEQFWGYVGFDACQVEHRWSASEKSILVAIAASIGAAIKRQHTEEQMRYQAFHDALTGLPNRTLFNDRLPQAIAQAQRIGGILGVMFLDLDRFKTINDTLGHPVGDRLLKQATARLTTCLREGDTIARWGGDEFTLLLPTLKSTEGAAKIAQRIQDALKPPFYLDGHELHVTSSIGIALYPQNGHDAETLLKNADSALYRVKAQGRNSYQFYNAAINSHASELLTLDSNLHQALERNEFVIYYQPQINIVTGKVTQMEALLRWQHPQLGLVAPKTFIRLAEENGMIIPIGEWVLQVACHQNKIWQAAGLPPVRTAVNLSARQFQQPNLVKQIAQILRHTELDPSCLELEITETAVMQDVDSTTALLHELREMGVRIAMDDFGTGYSSLSYLKKFPLHSLKIDQSFVRDLTDQSDDQAIITAIITLAKGLNLNVVAEGVETCEQMERLRSLNCSEMQGNWFSRALEAEAATDFLKKQQLKTKRHQVYNPSAPILFGKSQSENTA